MKWILFELKDSLLFKNGPIFVRLAFLLNFDLIFIGIVNYDDAKILQILCLKIFNPGYGNRGCRVFKGGIQNWNGFCLKIQRKLLNFENWCNGEVSKSAKISRCEL